MQIQLECLYRMMQFRLHCSPSKNDAPRNQSKSWRTQPMEHTRSENIQNLSNDIQRNKPPNNELTQHEKHTPKTPKPNLTHPPSFSPYNPTSPINPSNSPNPPASTPTSLPISLLCSSISLTSLRFSSCTFSTSSASFGCASRKRGVRCACIICCGERSEGLDGWGLLVDG
ncbi:hypothetical protein BJ508DRAFT_18525 [Ascobolus immersus RN42]|uniref:Uncharacterized protein n=1 Tax=Ascobolus immersus RN42 TaxID=1160509 RepID=A0A3N4HSL4_ASCIM|nr:hypothetical protein BJ508DRAFT_18525 [Ascobolus immersus RN42]